MGQKMLSERLLLLESLILPTFSQVKGKQPTNYLMSPTEVTQLLIELLQIW